MARLLEALESPVLLRVLALDPAPGPVLGARQRPPLNRVFVDSGGDGGKRSAYSRCVNTSITSSSPKTTYLQENATGGVVVQIPGFTDKAIPLFTVFRALGVESDRAILDMLQSSDDDSWLNSIVEGNSTHTHEGAVEKMMHLLPRYRTREGLYAALFQSFLPQAKTFDGKAVLLAQFARLLAKGADTDRDSYMNKRVATSGFIMAEMFSKFYNEFFQTMQSTVDNEYNIVHKAQYKFPFIKTFVTPVNRRTIFDWRPIQAGFESAFKSSSFVQDLSRISYMSYLSHLRRTEAPLDDRANVLGPHKLNGTSFGLVCPCESPDGRNVGLVKNLSLLARVTTHSMPTETVVEKLTGLSDVFSRKLCEGAGSTSVFVNNVMVGYTEEHAKLLGQVLKARRCSVFGDYASVFVADKGGRSEMHINTDEGRIVRPLFKVSASGLVEEDNVEWLDVEEVNHSTLIAATVLEATSRHSHCELHPIGMLSAYTSTIPFSNHNQGTRNVFSSAQGKQAIGVYATNFQDRIDVAGYALTYPQRPIVETQTARMLPGGGVLNNGENLIVAVACQGGYNMEDSVIINRSAIERGMMNLSVFKSIYVAEGHEEEEDENKSGMTTYDIAVGNPTEFFPERVEEYETLEASGLPKLNGYLGEGQVVVGRVRYIDRTQHLKVSDFESRVQVERTTDDVSARIGINEEGFVDRVCSKKGFVKVKIRKFRIPEAGDKLASRHGQKGVIGVTMAPEDMPRTASGVVPDLIMNPHAFPSRMTVGHLLEALFAKSAVVSGRVCADGTPFQRPDVAGVGSELAKMGFHDQGEELMYDGVSGAQIPTTVFMGPTYYFRLKHMVADKVNSRATGPRVGLTGQPTKGRANDGGMRIGEMERDALMAHGIASFLKESYAERSDGKYKTFLDADGAITYNNFARNLVGNKGSTLPIRATKVPASFKLLVQELQAFHLDLKCV